MAEEHLEAPAEEYRYLDRFMDFIRNYRDEDGNFKYMARLRRMMNFDLRSLPIDYADLYRYDPGLAEALIDDPRTVLREAAEAIKSIVSLENPQYAEKKKAFTPRIYGLFETVRIRELRSEHIGKLVQIEGIVTRMHPIRSRLVKAVFRHEKCGAEFEWPPGPHEAVGDYIEKPSICPVCGEGGGKFVLVKDKSKYIDWQKITLQEKPEDVPGGQMPRSVEVQLTEDLVDSARPGDRVTIVGIPSIAQTGGRSPLFELYVEANSISVSEKALEEISITREDEERIRELARDPWIRERIIASIAPSIYGHWDLKEAIALLLFGGVPKRMPDGTRIRGDIHVLFVGDPGVAKSQLLQSAARIAPRAVYTSGKGSTAAGLTAAVVRDPKTGEYYLEAGALVLADGGVAIIDEFDKMRPEDRTAIHEAMEQQSYAYDFEVLLANGTRARIGEVVDALISEHADRVIKGYETEILLNPDLWVFAYNPATGRLEPRRASRVSRHAAPPIVVEIVTADGRSFTVTPEHPVPVLSGDAIREKPAMDVRPGDLLPGAPCYERGVGEGLSASEARLLAARIARRAVLSGGRGESVPVVSERLPREIFAAGVDARRSFVQALLGGHRRVYTSSREAAEDVADILWSVGYRGRIERLGSGWLVRVLERRDCRGPVRGVPVSEVKIRSYSHKWVYDITVEPSQLFAGKGVILHNSISISKAGIVARLNARASILAAGNPRFGIYLPDKDFMDNVNLPPTIISRFDLIFVVRDVVDPRRDERLARYILEAHSNVERFKPEIETDLLKKYVIYARRYIKPRLTPQAKRMIKDFFVKMRAASPSRQGQGGEEARGIPITARQLEAIIRISEAHAKMALKEEVGEEDASEAIRITLAFLESVGYDVETGEIDASIIMTGKSLSMIRLISVVTDTIKSLRGDRDCVPFKEIARTVKERYKVSEAKIKEAFEKMEKDGLVYQPRTGCYNVV